MFSAIFIYNPLFAVVKKESMTINSFKINILLFFSFQVKYYLKLRNRIKIRELKVEILLSGF